MESDGEHSLTVGLGAARSGLESTGGSHGALICAAPLGAVERGRAALSIAAVACGGDDDDADDTTAATSADTTAATSAPATTGAADTTAGAATSAAPGGGGAGATLEELLERPTEITNTTPFEGEIPTDKEIVWIQCSVPACIALGGPLQEATDALGWSLKIVLHDGTPEG